MRQRKISGHGNETGKAVREIRGKAIRSKEKKKNNVVIIVSGEDAEKIKEEILLVVRKVKRTKELGFYIAPVEIASLETVQGFAGFSLKISAADNISETKYRFMYLIRVCQQRI